ncbi:MAG TPA: hypothetical protein VE863_14140 [Pyrinomonadaceae bacterium]|nr:hypothetical protein [Pyrinomonadaceae bacterium]
MPIQFINRNRLSFFLSICLCVAAVLGCKMLSKSNMFEGTAAKEAVDAFRGKLGGGPIKAISLEIESDTATLHAQDPKNPEHVDEYKYSRGIVVGPHPVQLDMLSRNLDKSLFNLDDVNVAATAAVAKAALERAKLEGGKIRRMTIERGLSLATDMTKSGAVSWHIEMEGTRENASAYADEKGNLRGVDLSQTARAAKFSTYDPETLRDAMPQIKQALGSNVKLLELTIYDKYLWFKAKSPKDGEITQYKYDINGVTTSALSNMTDPTPIEVRTHQFTLDQMLFDLDEVNLALAPELGRKALEKLGYADGRVTHYEVSRKPRKWLGKDLITVWDVSCDQGRKSGFVNFDMTGNQIEVNK